MALKSYSKFYFGFRVTEENQFLDFREDGDELTATLTVGDYTLAGFATEVAVAFNKVGTQIYSASANRSTRIITIEADSDFELLPNSGAHTDFTGYPLLGFDVSSDRAPGTSHSGDVGAGFEYSVQFPIQSYIPHKVQRKSIDATKKRTITGRTEVIRYGIESRMSCEFLFITDIQQNGSTPVRTKEGGHQAAIDFLEYAISQGEVEFMEDEAKPDAFWVYLLDSTEDESSGLGFTLKEEYDKGLPGYWRTGKLTWILQES